MKPFKVCFLTILLLINFNILSAQDCGCTINQIENNTVAPCNLTIGTVVNVSSAQQFKDAISQANNNGGNMTILIADGTYQVASLDSYPYLTANNVVIRSQSGNRDAVILTGGGMRDVLPATENGIYAVGNNITIADLTIKEVGNHAIAVQGDNFVAHNVKIQDAREQMLKGTGGGDGADNGKVQCCLFEYTAGIGPQFYIGGIDVHKGDDWVVNDNIFKNIASPSGSTAEHAVHFWRTGSNNIVERNVIINCDRGIGFGLGDDVNNGIIGGVIRNNMIYNNGNFPFSDVGIALEHCPDTKVYNNTIYIAYPRAIEYRWSATTNVDIANNLTNNSITSRDGAQAIVRNNLTTAQSDWFENTFSGNLRLNSDYPEVVNQGTFISEVSDDIDQTSRPQGNALDIGAYEFINEEEPEPPMINCGCTINQIENNTVAPCDLTIGTVVNVSSAQQFKDAISQANNNGGNMTILITNGTYQVASADSYPYLTASNVVIRSQSGNRDAVILTGGGMRDVLPATENGIYAVGNNITIADLTIKNVGNHAIAVQGDNLLVHNVKIQNAREQMLKGNSVGDGADNGKVQCCLFEYTAGIGPQWYIGGIDIHRADYWVINDNIFKNIASPSVAVAEHAVHFRSASANNTVERNVIINCDRGVGFGLNNDPNDGNVGGIIRNNMIYNDGTLPFNDTGIALEHSPGTKVYNNTIYIAYPRAIEYRFPATNNVDIANNLTNKLIASRDGGQATIRNNFAIAQSNWFENISSGNLRLNSDYDQVVDQGTFISEVSLDIDQTNRPQGNAFDIGAHEFQGGVEPPPPPPPMGDLPLYQMNQLTYGGAFRIPKGEYIPDNFLNPNYSQGPIAYNPDNQSIFLVGHTRESPIAEFTVPQLVTSSQITDLNMANRLQNFKKVLDFAPSGNPQALDRIGGLFYDNQVAPPRLLVNAYEYYDADRSVSLTTLIINDALNIAQSSISGYYQFDAEAGHTNGWMSSIPGQWQTALGGNTITGHSSGEPIISRWSVGPSAFSFNLQDFNGNTSTPISTSQLLDFSLDNRLADDLCNANFSNDLWTHMSRATYGFIIPNTRTYFTIGYSAGHGSGVCYKTAQEFGCAGCNQADCAGYCTFDPNDKYAYYWLWDIDDLIAVKNGNIASYEVLPYDYGIFDVPFEPEVKQIGGGSYDASTGQLYLTLQQADREQGTYDNPPLILVYNTNQIEATTVASQLRVESNYIQIQSTANRNVYEIIGNTSNYTIEILDESQQVYESFIGTNSPMQINTTGLPNGLYYILIKHKTNNKMSLQKIIKLE